MCMYMAMAQCALRKKTNEYIVKSKKEKMFEENMAGNYHVDGRPARMAHWIKD